MQQQNEQMESRWQKIGTQGEVLAIDSKKWAAVIDTETGMMWAINPIKTANFPNPRKMLTWSDARAWVDYVNTQGWCGFNDWQLPDVFDLKTLIITNKQGGLCIDQNLFKDFSTNRVCNSVWSSTSSSDVYAWVTSFDQGREFTSLKNNCRTVRFVRYIQKDITNKWIKIGVQGEELAIDSSCWAAAIDTKNQLMWAINPNKTADFPHSNEKMTWSEVIAWVDYANTKGWCGFNDWRLPTIYELKALLTEEKQPTYFIEEAIFNDIKHIMYCVWSSSSFDSWAGCVRFDFDNKKANYYLIYHHKAHIRLVRSV